MTLAIADVPVPLASDAHGVVRVGGTRATLDTVIAAFLDGTTAEEIAQQYSILAAIRPSEVYCSFHIIPAAPRGTPAGSSRPAPPPDAHRCSRVRAGRPRKPGSSPGRRCCRWPRPWTYRAG